MSTKLIWGMFPHKGATVKFLPRKLKKKKEKFISTEFHSCTTKIWGKVTNGIIIS